MIELDTDAIPKGGDDGLPNLDTGVVKGGELPSENPETSDALDALLKEGTAMPDDDAQKKADEDAAAAKAKADEDAAAAAAKAKVDEAPTESEEEKTARLAAEEAAKPKETYDKVELPPHAKKNSAEAFSKVKTLAKLEIDRVTAAAAAAKKEAEELKAKLAEGRPLDENTEKELTELRAFRQKLDVEADPAFKEFDARIVSNGETILAKMKLVGFPDDYIAKVKEVGVNEVDWEPILAKMPPSARRSIEAKLVENEDIAEQKTRAIAKAKENAGEYLKTREKSLSQSTEVFSAETKEKVSAYLPKLEWLKDQPIGKDAKPEEKKAIEAHNAFVKQIREDMDISIADNSAETKAILVVGYAQLRRVRADYENSKATWAAEKAALEKERDDAKGLVARVKSASTARLRESPATSPTSGAKKSDPLTESTGDSLDRLRDEALANQD